MVIASAVVAVLFFLFKKKKRQDELFCTLSTELKMNSTFYCE